MHGQFVFVQKKEFEEECEEMNRLVVRYGIVHCTSHNSSLWLQPYGVQYEKIPEYTWAMLEEVGRLKNTVESAGETEISSNMKGK